MCLCMEKWSNLQKCCQKRFEKSTTLGRDRFLSKFTDLLSKLDHFINVKSICRVAMKRSSFEKIVSKFLTKKVS
jgi:hypothetical protein